MENKLSIGDAGSLLIGAGLTKIDNLLVGVGLIVFGVALKVLVAILKKDGMEVETEK